MDRNSLYAAETMKSNSEFVKDLGKVVAKNGFVIHNEEKMEMAHSFGRHGIDVAEGFDLHMIQICKPEKAAKSLAANPDRAVLMPKFIMTYTRNGKTQIRFLRYSAEDILVVVDDEQLPGFLAETYRKIVSMIEEAK